jgi:hypothetical protein
VTTPNEAPRVPPRLVVARWMMAVALVLAMSACAPTKVRPVSSYVGGDTLPRPDRVLVYDFAISPEQVSLNRGLFSRLGRDVSSASVTDEELAIGREVADGFANELVKRIQLLGLPAERADATQVAPPGTLAITGQFLSIDEGNRMRRTLIGFGAGQSEVKALAQVALQTAHGPLLAEEFETKAESARTPGVGPMVGPGVAVRGAAGVASSVAVSGGVHALAEHRTEVEADARRIADELGKQLGRFFVRHGWITAREAR